MMMDDRDDELNSWLASETQTGRQPRLAETNVQPTPHTPTCSSNGSDAERLSELPVANYWQVVCNSDSLEAP